VPFETWLVPKVFRPAFGQVSLEELRELSAILLRTLARLAELLNDPDYNLVLHSVPVEDEKEEYFLWHLRIVPRLTHLAGFEIGSGMLIDIYKPEETARLVRGKI
jgi:UDPglucose--hexose-1-phosphate uridylyltransferase